jgi:hypothetical protein
MCVAFPINNVLFFIPARHTSERVEKCADDIEINICADGSKTNNCKNGSRTNICADGI